MEQTPSNVPSSQIPEAGAASPGHEPPRDAKSKVNWHDIEPILKWAAVAYGLGFLTVMWHTHRLGVPVLQLIEPVNIWIGAPLAMVLFFLDKLIKAARKVGANFLQGVRDARQIKDELSGSTADLLSLAERVSDIMATSLAIVFTPSVLIVPAKKVFKSLLSQYVRLIRRLQKNDPVATLKSDDPAAAEKQRKRTLIWIGRVLAWAQFVSATNRLINSVAMICFVPLACFFYVHVLFPRIPQTLGGGRPMSIQLILPAESVPKSKEFADWSLPEERTPQTGGSTDREKRSIVVPVTLYLRTDHDLYVRRGTGPIVCLSDHAVEGILF